MNFWTQLSVALAQQGNYLDELYKVYPIAQNSRREITKEEEIKIRNAYATKNKTELVKLLLKMERFPIKDSYVAFLKRDSGAIDKNPQAVNRIADILFQMGIEQILEKCTEPKETNRQIGPMFKRWVDQGTLGAPITRDENTFLNSQTNCVFNGSDLAMKNFAKKYLGFNREKGIDFLAKFNGKYVIAEAKFITDFGGHQNAQFDDAVRTMQSSFESKIVSEEIVPVSIMDGVLYIRGYHKMYRYLEDHPEQIIISALLLCDFLYSL